MPTRILKNAREEAAGDGLGYAGDVFPEDVETLVNELDAIIIDVRTFEERKFVGFVPDSIHVPWATGTAFNRNPRFAKELAGKVEKNRIVLFLCRSGKRSADAAGLATQAGFENAFNIAEGFEGDLDSESRRGNTNGWKFRNLPWRQD